MQEAGRQRVERALAATALFGSTATATIADLAALAAHRRWSVGRAIFQRGDEGDFLLVVTEGRVRLAVSSADGKELVIGYVGPGEVLGEFSEIDGRPRSADATAVEPTEAIVLHRAGFLRVAAARPDLGLALARHLCAQLRSTNYQMESIALYALKTRVARFLMLMLRETGDRPQPDEAELFLDITQGDLAAVLGASRPKVNKVLQMMLADGVLRRDGARILCSRAMLNNLVGAEAGAGLV